MSTFSPDLEARLDAIEADSRAREDALRGETQRQRTAVALAEALLAHLDGDGDPSLDAELEFRISQYRDDRRADLSANDSQNGE